MARSAIELRHTIEVIGEPSVKSDAAQVLLLRRIGSTALARAERRRQQVDAGNAVRSEITSFNRQAKSE